LGSLNPVVLRKINEWRVSPLLFAKECMHFTPSDQQAQILSTLPNSTHITVRSGHGVGKDACIAVAICWFMVTHAGTSDDGSDVMVCKVACTAPTGHQLSDILWSEIAKWMLGSEIKNEFVIQKDKIFHKDFPKTWWCRAITASAKATKEEQAETLAGLHEKHLMVVVDEASGVVDPIFIPLEGALTQEDNKCILIGNMTRNSGYFYDTHFHPEINKKWTKFHFDSRKSSLVKESMWQDMKTKYGEASNVFRIRVMGEPPLEDERTLISLSWAEQCIGNDIVASEDEPIYLGVDVARYGEDASIILPRRGNVISPWEEFHGLNTISLGGFILQSFQEMEAQGIAIDEIGVGAGVTDWLMKHNLRGLFGINVANMSSDITRYDRLRDELWVMVKEKCLAAKYSFPDIMRAGDTLSLGRQLANELSSPTYDFNVNGGIKVESKKQMRARGIASPNIADALCLSEYFNNISTKVFANKSQVKKDPNFRWREKQFGKGTGDNYAWMTA